MTSRAAPANQYAEGSEAALEAPLLRITLLGGFHLSAGEQSPPLTLRRSRRTAQLLKLLALEPGHVLNREQICATLWPEFPAESASNNLRQTLHLARRQLRALDLDASLLLSSQGDRVYLYPVDHLCIDVEAFEVAVRDARRSREPADYQAAINLYGGQLLPEDIYEDWTTARRESLASTYLTLLYEFAGLAEARDDDASALLVLRRITEFEPGEERAHVRLMQLYARTGRRPLALRQYGQLAQALQRELDATPEPETRQLFDAIKNGSYPPQTGNQRDPDLPALSTGIRDAREVKTNLPHSLTSFVGRDRDVAGVVNLISANRLVTLTGTGGCGKTRLAQEVGWHILSEESLPVWFVELAALTDPSLIADTIAGVLAVWREPGQDPLSALASQIDDRSLLLILDNCEHLVAACAGVVQTLLSRCPNLRILATSREVLRVPGEHRWLVRPLPLPKLNLSLAKLAENESVRLFFDRARGHRSDQSLTAENAAAATAICHRLDGLPLALELAAARTNILSMAQLAARLDDALGLLSDGQRGSDRQRTLAATLDWSFALLKPEERCFLERLAVFHGGWTLDAAESITIDHPEWSALDFLSMVVEKSLAQVDLNGEEARYRLLEPIRQYVARRFEASADMEPTLERHAYHYLALADMAESRLEGAEQPEWLARLDRENDNLRASVDWLLAHEPEAALRLVASLARYWELRTHLHEPRVWMERALSADRARTPVRARVLAAAGTLAWRTGNYAAAAALHLESLEIFREQGDVSGMALELVNLGAQELNQHQLGRAAELFLDGLRLAEQLGDDNIQAMAQINLGLTTLLQEDLEQSESYFTAGLETSRRLQNKHYISVAVQNLGEIAHHRGDDDRALELLRQSLRLSVELEAPVSTAFCLEEIAAILTSRGEGRLAARLLGRGSTIRSEARSPLPDGYRAQLYDPTLAALHDILDERDFTAEWEAGAALPIEELVAQALGVEASQGGTPTTNDSYPESLAQGTTTP